jgi:hypothetical protein
MAIRSKKTDRIPVQVCKVACDHKPFPIDVKGYKYLFCCEKGFKISLSEFQKQLKENPM